MTGHGSDDPPKVETRLPRALYELATSGSRDPADLVRLVAEHASELLRGDAVAVYLWDEAQGLLIPIFTNDPRQPLESIALSPGQGAAGQALQTHKTVVIEDYAQFEHAVRWAVERGVKAIEAIPLMVAGHPIGVLAIRYYGARPITGAAEEHVLNLLAALAAPALEAARLYATSTLEREHERTLRDITSTLAENLDERDVLELAVNRAAELLQSTYARVWLFEPNGELSCAAAEGYVQDETFRLRLAHDSTSGLAARQQIVNLGNAPADPGWFFNREFGERTGLGAYLGAGLWRAGQSLGVLEVMRQAGHRFSDAEEQLLVSLSNAVAVAVSNARTHAAVERLAREAELRAEQLAESERSLRSMYAAMGSGVLVMDPQGLVITANAAAEEILGQATADMVGRPPGVLQQQLLADGSLVPIEERPGARVARRRQAERKQVYTFTRGDGRRWLQLDVVPMFGPDGEVTRVVSSFIDVTDQKATEEALRRRDAILQAVTFAAEQLLSSAEWELSIDDALQRLGAATGVSRVYIVSADLNSGDLRQSVRHQWSAAEVAPRADIASAGSSLDALGLDRWESILRLGGIIQGEIGSFLEHEQVVLAAQGVRSLVMVPIFVGSTWWGFIGFDDCREERRWHPSLVEAVKTAAGTLGAAILRRRAEAERLQLVREQSARVEAEAAQRRLAFLAEAGQILAASLDYESSLQGVADLLVPGLADGCVFDMAQADGSVQRLAASGMTAFDHGAAVEPPVVTVIRSNEAWLSARALTVPLNTHAGVAGAMTWLASPGRAAFQMHDIDLAEHLARRCSLAIDSSRLYREARAAVSIRDEFLSVAAHELKTPMTSLRGYAQLLAREFDRGEAQNPDRARRAAQTIQVQSDKLARLVGQLLDVSRLQSGKLIIERKPSDVSELLHDVLAATRTQLKEHTLVAVLPRNVWATVDLLRVEQVVTNLIDNAIKYSPEGGPIDITLHCDAPANRLEITVRDHGVGVAEAHRAHIFDRFYQAHAGGALTSMAGMGLGLYISRQIVELHDGTIEAEFPADGGTRFVVRLPLN